MKRRGFTLIETMVAIGVVVLLAGIAYPVTMTVMGRAREGICLQNLSVIGAGLQQYLRDNGDRLPNLKTGRHSRTEDIPVIETELLDYAGNAQVFHCPADGKEFRKTGSSYFWNSALNGMAISEVSFMGIKDSPEMIPLISDKESWHPNQTNFLYADSSTSNKIRFVSAHK